MADLVPDVKEFIVRAAELVGSYADESFSIDCFQELPDNGVESPIEQFFYVAFNAAAEILNLASGIKAGRICQIQSQVEIGKYRVDFVASYVDWKNKKTFSQAVIECDGHAFHERSEQDRRYEKQRDRWLQAQGWKVLRFTGKEIKDNPFFVACEVIGFLTLAQAQDLLDEIQLYGKV